jgi:hypothetical protein
LGSVIAPFVLVLVTVIARPPRVAFAVTFATIVNVVALISRNELVVIPLPEKVTLSVLSKPLPVTVTVVDLPRGTAVGDTDVTLGPATTAKQPGQVPEPPSGFTTDRSLVPVVAPASTVTESDTDVAVTDLTVALTPVPDTCTVAPAWNPLPVTVTVCAVAP